MLGRAFEYERAESLSDACELLRRRGEGAKVIAGGQSLLPMVNLGLAAPEVVVDISRVEEARDITQDDGYLVIGALTTHRELLTDPLVRAAQPLLSEAARHVGNDRVRNRGTLGGSLAHSDPAAELPLVMTALAALYDLTDGRSARVVKADEFATGFLTTQLEPDEVVTAARVPVLGRGWGWAFHEVSRRDGDFAVVAAAALVRSIDGGIVEARLALGGIADHPVRMGAVEVALTGAGSEEISERVGAFGGLSPHSDTNTSAEYRKHLTRVLAIRALEQAYRRSVEAA